MASTLVATDLDGTFWDGTVHCHPTTFEALAELRGADVTVLLATGRRANSARVGLAINKLSLPAVLLNGALGIDFSPDLLGGTVFHSHAYSADAAAAVIAAFADHGLAPCVYTADGLVQSSHSPSTSPDHLASLGRDFQPHDDLGAVAETHDVLGMSILGLDHGALAPAAEQIASIGHGELAFYQDELYGSWSLMVQPPGITKWQGIEAFQRHVGRWADRVVAVGDGGNDIEMLEHADVSVAVTGSHADAVGVAEHVIPRPEDGGWAQLLDLI